MNYYIVDSENVAISTVVENIDKLDNKKDKLVLLYGDTRFQKVEPNAIDVLLRYKNVYMVEAFVGSKNALDFQLCEHLGELIGKQGKKAFNNRFYIVSRDTGYDKMVESLKSKGYSIARIVSLPAESNAGEAGFNAKMDDATLNDIIIRKYALSKAVDTTLLKMYEDMTGKKHPLVKYSEHKNSECGLRYVIGLLNSSERGLGASTHYSFSRAEIRKISNYTLRDKALRQYTSEHPKLYNNIKNLSIIHLISDMRLSTEVLEFIGAIIYFAESVEAIKYNIEKMLPLYFNMDNLTAKKVASIICGGSLSSMYNIDAKNFDYIDRDYNKEVWEYA